MPIDNPLLLTFVNESVRTLADRVAGLVGVPGPILDAAVGQGLPAVLGTTAEELLRGTPWTDDDYAALGAPQEIVGSGAGGRAPLTNFDVIAVLRVAAVLRYLIESNPALGPLLGKVAVNPRG